MRGKRSKQYRKLIQQFHINFGFREPYQVLIDAMMVQDTHRFTMDLVPALERTFHGRVKPMITQCSIRHLFAIPTTTTTTTTTPASASGSATPNPNVNKPNKTPSSPAPDQLATPIPPATKTALLAISRTLTLRKCNHHLLPAPLSALECHRSVIDPTSAGANRHRYALAAQDLGLRAWARSSVRGIPCVYVRRSVMILEPMAPASERAIGAINRDKLRAGIVRVGGGGGGGGGAGTKKRKRDEDEGGGAGAGAGEEKKNDEQRQGEGVEEDFEYKIVSKKRKKGWGPKGPNPLSVLKKKKKTTTNAVDAARVRMSGKGPSRAQGDPNGSGTVHGSGSMEDSVSRKRRRKHHGQGSGGDDVGAGGDD